MLVAPRPTRWEETKRNKEEKKGPKLLSSLTRPGADEI